MLILKKRALPIFTLALSLTAGSACSMMKNMDEMHDSTQDMSKTTQKMSATTEGMAQTTNHMSATTEGMSKTTNHMSSTTDHMAQTTDHMSSTTDGMAQTTNHMSTTTDAVEHHAQSTYEDLRQDNARRAREESLANMEKASAMETKLSEAGLYYMAYEFQLAKQYGIDLTEEHRVTLYHEAVEQYFRDIHRYMDNGMSVSPLSVKGYKQNLYALAATLHRVNPNVAESNEKLGVKDTTMLSLIEDALARKHDVETGKITPSAYEHEVLLNEQDAIYILRVRANFIPMIVLAKLTNLGHEGLVAKMGDIVIKSIFKFHGDLKDLNLDQIREYTTYINGANEVRDYLKKQGIDPELNGEVIHLFKQMKFRDADVTKPVANPKTDQDRAQNLRAEAIKKFLAGIEEFRNPKNK